VGWERRRSFRRPRCDGRLPQLLCTGDCHPDVCEIMATTLSVEIIFCGGDRAAESFLACVRHEVVGNRLVDVNNTVFADLGADIERDDPVVVARLALVVG
jgi:hypothetical protein